MHATAAVRADIDGSGASRLTTLRSDPPLLLRRTVAGCGAGAGDEGEVVHLMGGAAGPLGGDRLHLDIAVAEGASLSISSVAATMLLPGGRPSHLTISATVGAGGCLRWTPQPTISVRGSVHLQRVEVALAADAALWWTESLVLGRTGEPSGAIDTALRIERAARVLTHQQLQIGPGSVPGWAGAAVVGGHRLITTQVVVGDAEPADSGGDRVDGGTPGVARFRLADDAVVVQSVGDP